MTDLESSAVKKFRWRILLPVTLLIVLSSLDRANISFAALQMNDAIGLNPQAYGLAVGMFFVGYLLLQFPSTELLTRIGARRWIVACVVFWGIVATCMALVRAPMELYVLRFLLGCAESGFAPGVVYYTAQWMPERYRAHTIAITMLAVPVSVVIGGPLCGWLMTMHTPYGLAGWRWMFLTEGIATVVMGILAYVVVVDKAADAKWLTDAERQTLQSQANVAPRTDSSSILQNIFLAAREGRLWLAAIVWAATLIGANGMMFWLPQVMKELSKQQGLHFSDFELGVLSALPWLGVALGMIVNSWHSDKTRERYWHVAGGLVMAATGLSMAASTTGLLALSCLFIAGLGLGSAQGVFWSIPTSIIDKTRAAQGITLINLLGNVGSLLGPYIIGVIRNQNTSVVGPTAFVTAVLLLGLVFLFLLRNRHEALV